MTWAPIFYVSSQDFEGDIKSLKTVFSQFEKQIHQKDGYRFSPDAEFAMGWYFYTIYVKIGFIKKIRPDGKIDVSLQKQGFLNVLEKNCSIILNKLERKTKIFLTDKSSPDDIISQLNMSKKAFKSAIGVLYKKRKININSDHIRINKNI